MTTQFQTAEQIPVVQVRLVGAFPQFFVKRLRVDIIVASIGGPLGRIMGRVLLHMDIVVCFGPKSQIAYSAVPGFRVVPTNVGDRVLNLLEEGGALLEMADLEVLNLE